MKILLILFFLVYIASGCSKPKQTLGDLLTEMNAKDEAAKKVGLIYFHDKYWGHKDNEDGTVTIYTKDSIDSTNMTIVSQEKPQPAAGYMEVINGKLICYQY